ncbi:MAG: hypothetical protein V3V33_15120, partial [Candidatus Lokiarchaeia archaeon]
GRIGFAEVTVQKDLCIPTVTINSPTLNQLFNSTAPGFDVTITDEIGLSTTWYSLNGGVNTAFTGPTGSINQALWNALSEGDVVIRFYANDTLGRIGFAEVTIKKDVTAPIITINNVQANEVFGATAPNFYISIHNPNLAMTWYSLNGGVNSSWCCLNMDANMTCCCLHIAPNATCHCLNMVTMTCIEHFSLINQTLWDALPEGNITIRFYAIDSVGNIGFTDLTVYKQLKLIQEPGILEFLTSPAGLITMSILAGVAIGVIVVKKKKEIPFMEDSNNYDLKAISFKKAVKLKIYDYFERGYSTNKIISLLHLDEVISDSSEVVSALIKKKYFPLYNKCKSFTELRFSVLRDLFMDEIEKNVREGSILLERFDGFTGDSGCETNEISTLFQKNFKIYPSQLVIDKYGDMGLELIKKNKTKKDIVEYHENKRLSNEDILHQTALKLIRKNILENKISNYNGIQLCKDLNFDKEFGYSDKSLSAMCTKLIKKHIGISFEELVLNALNLRDKSITLIKEHIHEISKKPNRSSIYTIVDFFKDLGIYSILPKSRLDLHSDGYIRRFIGFSSWQSLLTFVKNKFFKDQTFDWEIGFNYFLEFYKKNPNNSSEVYFKKFPNIPKRTISNWLTKCKNLLEEKS